MATVLSVWDRALGLTDHASARMQQRGITAPMIGIALEYGERTWSHGAVCWRLTERCLCGTPHEGESDHLRGLCVVVGRDGALITAKWDYRLRRPGPLRRSNPSRTRILRAARRRSERPQVELADCTVLPLAA